MPRERQHKARSTDQDEMEAPIDFEIWGTVAVPLTDSIQVSLRHNPEIVRLDALRILHRSRTLVEPVTLAVHVRWADCEVARSTLGTIARDISVYQAGWGRAPNAIWCPRHEVYYGGVSAVRSVTRTLAYDGDPLSLPVNGDIAPLSQPRSRGKGCRRDRDDSGFLRLHSRECRDRSASR